MHNDFRHHRHSAREGRNALALMKLSLFELAAVIANSARLFHYLARWWPSKSNSRSSIVIVTDLSISPSNRIYKLILDGLQVSAAQKTSYLSAM